VTRTKIEWCDFTWNPVIGCTGSCTYCYARKMAHRFHMGRPDFIPEWNQRNFDKPFPRKPSRIFVNSMSDVADWKSVWMRQVEGRIQDHPEHLFLMLSKRPWDVEWYHSANAMLGYSATCMDDLFIAADHFRKQSRVFMGPVTFLSLEPLHGPIHLNMEWLPRWIIVGAETGNRKGRVVPKLEWLSEIQQYARQNSIPLFFKSSLRAIWILGYFPQEYPA
jgi:protein gp37